MKHEIRNPKSDLSAEALAKVETNSIRQPADEIQSRKTASFVFRALIIFAFVLVPLTASAQNNTRTLTTATPDTPELNPNNSAFKIVVCDGPEGARPSGDTKYVACDFNGVMLQIQHLINIMMVLGVFASIAAFSWAGWLYISGVPANKTKAHAIFPKIFTGFIIMLSAWFIVYQILSWLTDNNGFKTLLGSP
jgi:hypothetical protein